MIEAFGVSFQNPILLAAGTAGFGREVAGVIDLDSLGGIVTKAVSPEPRAGNRAPRVAEFAGGMVNSVGLANPGVDVVNDSELEWLEKHLEAARVIVNVVGDRPGDYVEVVERLGQRDVVAAFELNVSCPNTDRGGEEFGADTAVLSDLVSRTVAVTDKPVLAKLSPVLPDIVSTTRAAVSAGVSAVTLVNTVPGFLYGDGAGEARLGRGQGGVSGPGLLPIGVNAVRRVVKEVGVPVVGVGGVTCYDDVEQYLEAGASLVAVGTAALASPRIPQRLASTWVWRRQHGS